MFSERLKRAREQQGYTQAELARRAGIGRDLYNKYERTSTLPSETVLLKLADVLNVSLDYLYGREDYEMDAVPPLDANSQKVNQDEHEIKDEDIMFALYGAVNEITDTQFKEVKRLIQLQKERQQ